MKKILLAFAFLPMLSFAQENSNENVFMNPLYFGNIMTNEQIKGNNNIQRKYEIENNKKNIENRRLEENIKNYNIVETKNKDNIHWFDIVFFAFCSEFGYCSRVIDICKCQGRCLCSFPFLNKFFR